MVSSIITEVWIFFEFPEFSNVYSIEFGMCSNVELSFSYCMEQILKIF